MKELRRQTSKSFYEIMVVANDSTGDSQPITVIIVVTDVNEAPMFVDAEAPLPGCRDAVLENTMADQPIGLPVTATDPEDGTLTYDLSDVPGSTDKDAFTIDNTGQLKTRGPLNVETKPNIW